MRVERPWVIVVIAITVIEFLLLLKCLLGAYEVAFSRPDQLKAVGTITQRDFGRGGTSVRVKFQTRSGEVHEGWTSPGLPARTRIGDKVTVFYPPAHPGAFALSEPRWLPLDAVCLALWSLVTWVVWRAALEKTRFVEGTGRHSASGPANLPASPEPLDSSPT